MSGGLWVDQDVISDERMNRKTNYVSGSASGTTYGGQVWVDDVNNMLNFRNGVNNAWIALLKASGSISVTDITATGNITVNGTVDGVDISALLLKTTKVTDLYTIWDKTTKIAFADTTITKSDLGLGSVENTALSTWKGTTNVNTVGTIYTGSWSGSTINASKLDLSGVVPTSRTVAGHALSANVTLDKTDVGLNNVENTALSTWKGTTNVNTLGTVKTGSWQATVIDSAYLDLADVVPKTTTVNGHALSSNVSVTASDVGLGNVQNIALSTWTGSTSITTLGTITTGTWNGTTISAAKLDLSGVVPTSRTVNSKALSSNISITASDVGLGNVENITLTTFTGSTNIIRLGTVKTGTWQASQITCGYLNLNSAAGTKTGDLGNIWSKSTKIAFGDTTITKSDLSLGNVENTALSTWAGTANITTVGNITSGTWSGSTIVASKLDLTGVVPTSRTVNSKALSSNITITASDVGLGSVENTALSTWKGTTNVNTLGTIYTGSWSGSQIVASKLDLSGVVPTSRTVNGHALSSNVTVTKSDVSLGNVENTALSTWKGTANINTIGTIKTGSWQASAITAAYLNLNSAAGTKTTDLGNLWDKTTKIAFADIATGSTPTTWTVAWSQITGKPATYAPSAHTQASSTITDWGTYINQAVLTTSNPTFATVTTSPHIIDTSTAYDLIIASDSTTAFTADRILTIDLNNAARTLALQGNLTVESASYINQDLTTNAAVTFAGATINGNIACTGTVDGVDISALLIKTSKVTDLYTIWDKTTKIALADTTITLAGLGGVATSVTVNGHALSSNVTVTKSDVGLGSVENTALSTWKGTTNVNTLGTITTGSWSASVIAAAKLDLSGVVPTSRTVNGHALSANVTVTKGDVGLGSVENTALSTWSAGRTVNGHALNANVTVTKGDVGLGSVENTALSTWKGTTAVNTLGTIKTGSWTASQIAGTYLNLNTAAGTKTGDLANLWTKATKIAFADTSITKSDLGLGSVENTALSTWKGTANVNTLGTVKTGSWQGSQIAATYLNLSGVVPTSRTVNGHALSANVTVTKGDVGLGSVENTAISTWAGSTAITTVGTITSGTWSGSTIAAAKLNLSGVVPTSRTVNGHALSGNVTVTKGDVGLGSVENTALSTWAGSSNITTVGTLSSLTVSTTMIIPVLASDPASPVAGQIWVVSS